LTYATLFPGSGLGRLSRLRFRWLGSRGLGRLLLFLLWCLRLLLGLGWGLWLWGLFLLGFGLLLCGFLWCFRALGAATRSRFELDEILSHGDGVFFVDEEFLDSAGLWGVDRDIDL
jgi:hypothetical protein